MEENYTEKTERSTQEEKKEEKTSRPEVIPWNQIASELEQGGSTASGDDTEHAHTGSTTPSEGDPRPSKMSRVSNAREEISDVMPEQFCHVLSIKRVKP